MKLKQWLYGAAALAMLAACSDKDIAPGGGDDPNGGISSTSSGYIAVEIKLPQEAGTRAEDAGAKNDNFDDGTPDEYKVTNAMIVIFKGTENNEKDATFVKAVDLVKPFFTNMPENDQITSSYVAAVPVDEISGDDHYFGLVFLNRDNINFYVQEGKDGFKSGVKIAGKDLIEKVTKFSDILDYDTSIDFITDAGFFMTNAPLSTAKGSADSKSSDIHYLADLGNKTYESMEEAKSKVANCIYVERAVAKVTSGLGNNAFLMSFIGEDGNPVEGLNVTANVQFALTNTNVSSYVVRNVETAKLGKHFSWSLVHPTYPVRFRMIGTSPMPGLESPFHANTQAKTSLYRTYWCHDPNYNSDMTSSQKHVFNPKNEGDVFSNIKDSNKDLIPLYCKENTFDVAHQNNGNSTMVVFKIDLTISKPATEGENDGATYDNLFIRGGDDTKVYLTQKAATAPEVNRVVNDKNVQDALKAALTASGLKASDFEDTDGVVTNAQNFLNLVFEKDNDNLLLLKSVNLVKKDGINDDGVTAFQSLIGNSTGTYVSETKEDGTQVKPQTLKTLIDNVNAISDILEYTGGISYYTIPIKHFGDWYCPWPKATLGTTTEQVYNDSKSFTDEDLTHAEKYLGRYGVVRNNWYDLKITEVKHMGSAEFPEISLKLSDDNNEQKKYIGVEIHVLSWAKRTQNVEF